MRLQSSSRRAYCVSVALICWPTVATCIDFKFIEPDSATIWDISKNNVLAYQYTGNDDIGGQFDLGLLSQPDPQTQAVALTGDFAHLVFSSASGGDEFYIPSDDWLDLVGPIGQTASGGYFFTVNDATGSIVGTSDLFALANSSTAASSSSSSSSLMITLTASSPTETSDTTTHTKTRSTVSIAATSKMSSSSNISPNPPSSLSAAAKAGIGIGVAVVTIIFLLTSICVFRHRRRRRAVDALRGPTVKRVESFTYRKAELEGDLPPKHIESTPRLPAERKNNNTPIHDNGAPSVALLSASNDSRMCQVPEQPITSPLCSSSRIDEYEDKELVDPAHPISRPSSFPAGPLNRSGSEQTASEDLIRWSDAEMDRLHTQERQLAQEIQAHESLQILRTEHAALLERIHEAEQKAKAIRNSSATY